MNIYENYGLVPNKDSYKELVKYIVEYVYDPEYGPQNNNNEKKIYTDFFYDEEKTREYYIFSLKDVKNWYYINHFKKFPELDWFKDFKITIDIVNNENKNSENYKDLDGFFSPDKSLYDEQNKKLDIIYIYCKNFLNREENEKKLYLLLIHEFRHAYDLYLENKYGKNKNNKFYLHTNTDFSNGDLIKNKKVNPEVYKNYNLCLKMYEFIFYKISYLEQKANIETFSEDIILNKNKDIKDYSNYFYYNIILDFINNSNNISDFLKENILYDFYNDFKKIIQYKLLDNLNFKYYKDLKFIELFCQDKISTDPDIPEMAKFTKSLITVFIKIVINSFEKFILKKPQALLNINNTSNINKTFSNIYDKIKDQILKVLSKLKKIYYNNNQ